MPEANVTIFLQRFGRGGRYEGNHMRAGSLGYASILCPSDFSSSVVCSHNH